MGSTAERAGHEYIPAAWEDVACPFCGSADAYLLERFGPDHRYTYVRCRECHLAYQNPRPRYDEAFIETAYSQYATTVTDYWDGEKPTTYGVRLFARMEDILEEIEELAGARGRILDIGCHTGFFSKIARDRGWTVTGVDVSETMVEIARAEFGLNAIAGDWTSMAFEAPFDVIYCSHVIEHIPDPVRWMRCFRERLAPNGLLCIETPNMQSIDRLWKRLLKRLRLRRNRWAHGRTPDHLYEPCTRSMVPFLERNGFEVLRGYTYSRSEKRGLTSDLYYRVLGWGSNLRFYLRPAGDS